MASQDCPHCGISLTAKEASQSNCPVCKKPLTAGPSGLSMSEPPYIPKTLSPIQPVAAKQYASIPNPQGKKRFHWGYVLFGLLLLALGIWFEVLAFTGEAEKMEPSTSRKTRAVEEALGMTGSTILFGLVGIGAGAYMLYASYGVQPEKQTYSGFKGWWVVPLPEVRQAQARAASTKGLIAAVPLALVFCGLPLAIPLLGGPMDMGGVICLGPGGGLALAAAVHLYLSRGGNRLSALSWFMLPVIFLGLVWGVNAMAVDRDMEALKTRIEQGEEDPEFDPDDELKTAFIQLLDEMGTGSNRKIFIQVVEHHDSEVPDKAQKELDLWKLDPDFITFLVDKQEIPGSTLKLETIGSYAIQRKLSETFQEIIPEKKLEIVPLEADGSTEGERVIQLEATTRHEGTFSKFTPAGYGKPNLIANFRIDWKVSILDRTGKTLYTDNWSTYPTEKLRVTSVSYGNPLATLSPGEMYAGMQRSAHDNFAREFLGRLGLPPGEVQTSISANGS